MRDTGRTNSDLGSIPCSAINTSIVELRLAPAASILDQFGTIPGLGKRVNQPNWNFAPQAGIAWDPGRHWQTVVRAGGGMFFDNFLLQNAYQDRISRLSKGQYFRSLSLCPAGTMLFPDGSTGEQSGRLDIAHANLRTADWRHGRRRRSRICSALSGSTVGGDGRTERVFAGEQPGQFRRHAGAQFPHASGAAHERRHSAPVGRAQRVLDRLRAADRHAVPAGDRHQSRGRREISHGWKQSGVTQNTYKAELDAINATLRVSRAGCTPATSAGSSSQTAIHCYLDAVPARQHFRFCAQRARLFERLLWPVSVFGAGLADCSLQRNQSCRGIERHVLSERTFQVSGVHVAFHTGRPTPVAPSGTGTWRFPTPIRSMRATWRRRMAAAAIFRC